MLGRSLAIVMVALVVVAGCGGPSTETVQPPEVSPIDAIRAALQPAAAGEPAGSELGAIAEQITTLKETDPALASVLSTDHEQLMQLMSRNPGGVKAKAQEMLDKLNGAGG